MPDLLSHLIIGLILAEIFNIRKKSLVALGAILPDVLAKFDLLIFYLGVPKIITFDSFHTPFMFFLLSVLIAGLFRYDKVKAIASLNIGSMSEFLSDLMVRHFNKTGVRLFFPFSLKNYSLAWVWPEQSLYVILPASLFVYLLVIVYKKKRK